MFHVTSELDSRSEAATKELQPTSVSSTTGDDCVLTNLRQTSTFYTGVISRHERDSGYEPSSPSVTNDDSYEDGKLSHFDKMTLQDNVNSTTDYDTGLCLDDDSSWTVLMEYSNRDFQTLQDNNDDSDEFQCRLTSDHYASRRSRSRPNCDNEDHPPVSGGEGGCISRPSSLPMAIPIITHDCDARSRFSPESSSRSHIDIASTSRSTTSIQIPSVGRRPKSLINRPFSSSPLQTLSWPVFQPLLDWWRRPVDESAASRFFHPDEEDCAIDVDELLIEDEVFEDDDGETEKFSFGNEIVTNSSLSEDRYRQLVRPPTVANFSSSCSVDLNRNILEQSTAERHDLRESCTTVGQMLRRLSDDFRPRGSDQKDDPTSRRYPQHQRLERLTSRDIRQIFCTG